MHSELTWHNRWQQQQCERQQCANSGDPLHLKNALHTQRVNNAGCTICVTVSLQLHHTMQHTTLAVGLSSSTMRHSY